MKLRTIVVTAAVAVVMVACSPTGSETPNPTRETPPSTTTEVITPKQSSTPTPSPTPSPTVIQSFPPPAVGETEEQAAIREGWMNYWKVLDKFVKEPQISDFNETQEVTVAESEQSKAILDEIQYLKDRNWRVVGHQVLRDFVVDVQQTNGPQQTATVTYCYDGSQRQVVANDTGQKVEADPPEFLLETALFEKGLDGIWRVSSISNEAAKC